MATGYLPDALPGLSHERYWGMGAVAALLLFLSVLLHELGHSYVAKRYHIPIAQITLFIFGGVAHMGKEPPHPRAEFLIAIAGPAVSFVLGVLCLTLAMTADTVFPGPSVRGFVVLGGLLGMVNVQLGLFNLIPGFPLDGGRMLRAGLWAWSKNLYRATGHAAMFGLWCGVLFCLIGAWIVGESLFGGGEQSVAGNGGWLLFIGAFLFSAAWNARKQASLRMALEATTVEEVMVRTPLVIPSHLTVRAAVDDYFVAHGFSGFPVAEGDSVTGVITVDDLQRVPQALWDWRTVRDVMSPASPDLFVTRDRTVKQALDRMARTGRDRLVVMEEERPVGLITQSSVVTFFQLHRNGRAQKKPDT
ncbi:putative Membrane-associated zinc metallopeptidase containing CBS domain pair [Nitrospira sp. KM1]|nr:putative Membrane-associated zinc metallopeptidase containing CBS domain pair [Nitrospira sp. KM1]